MISQLRAHRHRISFHFHLGSNFFEQCRREEPAKEKFHVIHCSSTSLINLGLVNLLSSTSRCLINSDAVLLTNINLSAMARDFKVTSAVQYIESVLCCPLSLIPTLYGLRLTNHPQLGSQSPLKLHDEMKKNYFRVLKWQLSPCYSQNIPLEISPILENAISKLASSSWLLMDLSCMPSCSTVIFTFNLILQSLSTRCKLLPDITTLQSLHLDKIPSCFRLTLRTEQAWKNGQPVLRYSLTNSVRNAILENAQFCLELYSIEEISLMCSNQDSVPLSYTNVQTQHRILFHQHKDVADYFSLTQEILKDRSFYFLLPEVNESDYFVCLMSDKKIYFHAALKSFKSKSIRNPTPFFQQTIPQQAAANSFGFQVQKCTETEDSYKLEVNVRGIQVISVNGKFCDLLPEILFSFFCIIVDFSFCMQMLSSRPTSSIHPFRPTRLRCRCQMLNHSFFKFLGLFCQMQLKFLSINRRRKRRKSSFVSS